MCFTNELISIGYQHFVVNTLTDGSTSDSSTILPSPEGQREIDFTTVLIPVSALTVSDSLVRVSLHNHSSNSLKLLPFSASDIDFFYS